MRKKLIYLVSIVLVLALMSGSPCAAATLLRYSFADGSGTNVTDLSGNGNHGTLVGFANTVAGSGRFDSSEGWVAGGGLCFIDDSVRSYVETPLNLNALPGDFTLEFMANYAGSSGWTPAIGSNASGCCAESIYFGIHNNLTNAEVRLQNSGGPVGLHPWSSPPDMTVYHLALVYDAATDGVEVFVDGASIGTGTKSAANMAGVSTQFRIGNTGWASGEQWDGILFGIAISDVKLDPDSFALLTAPALPTASGPNPANGATDAPRDVTLSWMPGEFAPALNGHRVYLSESFGDVDDGVGGVTLSGASYAPAQRLAFETTYYWRVDEVNAPPDSTVFKGDVWSFTTEPFAYAIDNVIAAASSSSPGKDPENTINGSGLDDMGLLHGNVSQNTMWLSGGAGTVEPAWIGFEFDQVYKLHELWVWNSNDSFEQAVGFGFKDVTIEYSVDGANYTTLGTTHEFAQAPGTSDYSHNTTVGFGGASAKYVKLTANSNWGSTLSGLSEVRFFYTPVNAREPSPDSGATDVDPNVTLAWRAGREAATHDVYVGVDEQAVIDGTAPVMTVTDASYSSALDLASTYYWRVDEVNKAETPSTWQGDIWSFSTPEYLVVDDFESYNDIDPPDPQSQRIFESWIDGFGIQTNGALVGYDPPQPSYTETTIIRGGIQSMPLFYSNTGGATYSEATRTFATPQDWANYGIQTLGLWFHGTPGNTGQLYVKIDGVKVPYDGDADALARPLWTLWTIDLSVGANLRSVTTLTVGVDGATAAGTVYVDDIALYRIAPQGPQSPGADSLVAYYAMENNTRDASGAGNDGVLVDGRFAQDAYRGTVLVFDGIDDVVEVPHSASIGFNDATNLTLTLWAKPTKLPRPTWTGVITKNRDVGAGSAYGIWISTSNQWHFRVGGTAGNANVPAAPGATEEWHFVVMTHDADATTLRGYLDGRMIYENTNSNPAPLTAQSPLWIGGAQSVTEYYPGMLDEVRIYNRVLSSGEMSFVGTQ